ncbi:MAG: class I SAM-dependent methyltransferase [Magnetococcales bacterium]|nr:class I SAM-dependent methyltransferase [Magnetococcales bacterium]
MSARIAYETCPLCASNDIYSILQADCSKHQLYNPVIPPVINWVGCAVCDHVFTDGYFTPEAQTILFSKTEPDQVVGHDLENQRHISARIIEKVARQIDQGDWLDVGFGNGSLLFTAHEWGYTPVGIDLREDNVRILRSLGFEAHSIPIETFDHPDRFSVISMADVLEHMPFPCRGLQAAQRLLHANGVLFLSMPNMGSLAWQLLDHKKTNPYWGAIEHFHNFSRERLYALLKTHGFTPIHYDVSKRYRVCMEIVAVKTSQTGNQDH